MIKNYRILIPFNASWQDGCDYAQQTIRLLAGSNQVVAVPMAHERSLLIFFIDLFKTSSFFEIWNQAEVFTPVVFLPFRRFLLVKKCNILLNVLLIQSILSFKAIFNGQKNQKHSQSKQLVWFFEPQFSSLWLQLLGNTWKSIYDCVDFWPGFSGEISRQHYNLLDKANFVAVNSHALLQSVKKVRADVIQVPLGFADLDFAQANLGVKTTHNNKKSNQQSLVFGFVGQIGNRFDFNWLLSLIQAFPRHKFEFVGSVWSWKELDDNEMNQKIDILKSQPNCIFKPPVPKSEIPAVIAHFDFGLIPYDTTQVFNKNCHPLKLYEYWYFGKPVIATAITELKKSQNVLIASDKIVEVIAWTQATITKGYPDSKRKLSQRKAAANSWQAKIQEISELIEKGGSS